LSGPARDLRETAEILRRAGRGDRAAVEELLPLVYDELRGIARAAVGREAPGHTLQATALVNEAWIRLFGPAGLEWEDRAHFLAIAARSMRQVLVDHARRKKAGKRGGGAERVALDEALAQYERDGTDLLALSEALDRLVAVDERRGRVVELRFFCGLTIDETARALDVAPKTAEADWYLARAWLRRELGR